MSELAIVALALAQTAFGVWLGWWLCMWCSKRRLATLEREGHIWVLVKMSDVARHRAPPCQPGARAAINRRE